MSKFNIGDTVRSDIDERPIVLENPLLNMLVTLAGNDKRLRDSLDKMPVPTGTVIATGVTYVRGDLGITLHDAVMVDLIDGRRNVPYPEESLELVQSFDDELTSLLESGSTE